MSNIAYEAAGMTYLEKLIQEASDVGTWIQGLRQEILTCAKFIPLGEKPDDQALKDEQLGYMWSYYDCLLQRIASKQGGSLDGVDPIL
jgi:hypothetical protein